ncbi:histidinol-phosphate aminotransferase [Microbotryum lychnidis-dioicae p1A1 Lamole]|uniref:histidinol-phosphate transaminase n=1 Tax=Microbotryum lychnidis-dioicae (strain p1A1 Lamole / MvSl-1064) TaxID=683840 RepID=U5H6P6_USTV1|nr:histidinol-phosphate aminotransferase [Microbotryum lychnidis-dioicae p1A1 Lamole]|eukprot:KDE06748.1 histidinol-phosphate aminotransferase [Microbotryum lychnidis-dioicae p1A1 Lamole]
MVANPPHFTLSAAIRPNILSLTPYRCARDDYSEGILLDANENSLGHSLPSAASSPNQPKHEDPTEEFDSLDLHRYPSPTHIPVKQRLCHLRNVPSTDHTFLGVGSDEVIDLLVRITCAPQKDRILICPPTYGMYAVCAQINDVDVIKVPLECERGRFQLDVETINSTITSAASTPNPIKLVFICSPGNPTGTLIPLPAIRSILDNPNFTGLVVVDEAYIDFCPSPSTDSAVSLATSQKGAYDNLVVMQTLSKGFGLAAIRLGVAYGSKEVIQVLNNIKAPYNVSTPTAALALRALSEQALGTFRNKIATLGANRQFLAKELVKLPQVVGLLGSGNANFLMVQIASSQDQTKVDNDRAKRVYTFMAEQEAVVVRFRGNEIGCEGCLRVTIGTRDECETVLDKLKKAFEVTK